ncbi:hypothetical protein CCM_00689 [Cordyceps militaris CM01]|uniref:Uncharacterized protein n=1 Tax=Cordyceps militaris (strain CM01) TaxID=983644 RepID=G3J5H3_CORMM|nr:uncharacterized protein CCM_00689 [Cordyceps militaris CM01]EGX96034.1 hypothetical protein CCM_00689 [Cordyceps militaris CM01]
MRSQLDALSCRRTLLLFMQIHLRGGLTDGGCVHAAPPWFRDAYLPEGQREAAVENAGHGCIPRRRKWGSGLRSDGARIGRAALTNKTPSRAALDDKGHSGLKVQVYNGELRLNDQVAA